MISAFKQNIDDSGLFGPKDRILLTVSGGIDSRFMLELFSLAKLRFGIAHCNFQLREAEADRDEMFVKNLASRLNVPFYSIRFNTREYAEKNRISIQMAARDLRYQWFEEVRKQNHYDYIALAHNKDDQEETFFINLIRGTGIRGLSGIKARSNRIVRPILFASRKAIHEYITKNKIDYVEDSSNAEIRYVRNRIRHRIIPEFEKIQADFRNSLDKTIAYLSETEMLLQDVIVHKKKEIVSEENGKVYIDKIKLESYKFRKIFLFELLKPYGFSSSILQDILEALNTTPGKQFFSENYRLISDRKYLILTRKTSSDPEQYIIEAVQNEIIRPIRIRMKEFGFNTGYIPPSDPCIATLDADKTIFPLTLRKWKQGDRFFPFGMQNSKKLSNFFIDLKLSLDDKEKTWLLCSGEKIIWVIGKRIDDRFKITGDTKRIIQFEWIRK
jgi:tRNA(Ile)-lysidine synthase